MKLEDQVVSLELAKKLKELGIKQESYILWKKYEGKPYLVADISALNSEGTMEASAFTVAELGMILPNGYHSLIKHPAQWVCFDENGEHGKSERTEANARAECLIHLIEKGLMKI